MDASDASIDVNGQIPNAILSHPAEVAIDVHSVDGGGQVPQSELDVHSLNGART